MSHQVFVYGSLRAGMGNHRLLTESVLVERKVLNTKHFMVSLGGYPALLPCPETRAITGEVYEVDNSTMARLDQLEGHPNFYKREVIDGAWVYILQGDQHDRQNPLVESGDWVDYYNRK